MVPVTCSESPSVPKDLLLIGYTDMLWRKFTQFPRYCESCGDLGVSVSSSFRLYSCGCLGRVCGNCTKSLLERVRAADLPASGDHSFILYVLVPGCRDCHQYGWNDSAEYDEKIGVEENVVDVSEVARKAERRLHLRISFFVVPTVTLRYMMCFLPA